MALRFQPAPEMTTSPLSLPCMGGADMEATFLGEWDGCPTGRYAPAQFGFSPAQQPLAGSVSFQGRSVSLMEFCRVSSGRPHVSGSKRRPLAPCVAPPPAFDEAPCGAQPSPVDIPMSGGCTPTTPGACSPPINGAAPCASEAAAASSQQMYVQKRRRVHVE